MADDVDTVGISKLGFSLKAEFLFHSEIHTGERVLYCATLSDYLPLPLAFPG